MPFELNIKNIGKLTDAKLRIGQFTVLAGPNNTGKSFVSKSLYSILDAMNAGYAGMHIDNLVNSILMNLTGLTGHSNMIDELITPFEESVEALRNVIITCRHENIEHLDDHISMYISHAKTARSAFTNIRQSIESLNGMNDNADLPPFSFEKYFDEIEQLLEELEVELAGADQNEFISSSIKYKIEENLLDTFQVATFANLKADVNMPSKIGGSNFGVFEFLNKQTKFSVDIARLREWQELSNVIYLESPVYWKLKNALENIRLRPRHWHRRGRITGVPGYFYDLTNILRYEYQGDVAFPNVYKKLTGKSVLGGKVAISENGDLSFCENDRNFSLPVTAMGVANLGILALLIERKVLDKGSFIFIDEPEAHLHPAWQVVMAEVLFELAKGGVNVVIATHSADILKWLEVHVKNNPDDEKLIALNKFPVNGDALDKQNFSEKIADIKRELTQPFADLYVAGL